MIHKFKLKTDHVAITPAVRAYALGLSLELSKKYFHDESSSYVVIDPYPISSQRDDLLTKDEIVESLEQHVGPEKNLRIESKPGKLKNEQKKERSNNSS